MKKHFSILVLLIVIALSGCANGNVVSPDTTDTKTYDAVITSPIEGETISSPLTITGEAKGTWFFEASMPVKLVDQDGNVIVQGNVQAIEDWQTTDYVGFEGTIAFKTDAQEGQLILQRDNPSGLSENDDEISIEVKF